MQTKVAGKDVLPMGGEYTAPVVVTGMRAFFWPTRPSCCAPAAILILRPFSRTTRSRRSPGGAAPTAGLLHRLPGG